MGFRLEHSGAETLEVLLSVSFLGTLVGVLLLTLPSKRKLGRDVALVGFVFLCGATLIDVGWYSGKHAKTLKRTVSAALHSKVSGVDLRPYSSVHYPRYFRRYGAGRVLGEIQALRKAGVRIAAADGACDSVAASELSEAESTYDVPVIFVHCANGYRLYLSREGVLSRKMMRGFI